MKTISTPVAGQIWYDREIGWTMKYDGEKWVKYEKGCERIIAKERYSRAVNNWMMRLGLQGEKPKWEDFYQKEDQ